jgi:hypothetical protein
MHNKPQRLRCFRSLSRLALNGRRRRRTLNLLTTTIVAPPSNASKWQMGFNSAFKGLIRSYERNCKGFCRNDVLKSHKTFDSVCPNKGQEFRLHQTADITLHLIKIYPDVTSHIKQLHTTTLMYCIMNVFQTSLNITTAATNRMRFLVVREEM